VRIATGRAAVTTGPLARARKRAIRAAGAMVPNIILNAPTGHLYGNGGRSVGPPFDRPTAVAAAVVCINQNFRTV